MGDRPVDRAPILPAAVAGALILAAVAIVTWLALPPAPKHKDVLPLDDQTDQSATPSTIDPKVATLSPAATDLVIGIGAAEHLVAVSDFDEDRPGTQDLPRVGDFDHVDWEKLAAAGPKILLTQFGDRMPAALRQRCDQLGIQLVDVKLDVLEDIYAQADRLGGLLGVQGQERQAVNALQRNLADISRRAANLPPVRAAIAMSEGTAVGLIGPHTFHDQLLQICGGINVAAKLGKPYVNVDREQMFALAPEVVLDLQPTPPTTPQELRQAKRFWDSLPDLPAVRNKRICTITAAYCRRPGWHVDELAEIFFQDLHGNHP
jgi:ABC-type Fe3+-hydroxamate transport system substrate-binding protein